MMKPRGDSTDSQAELWLKAIGDITGEFEVRAYQRGYRWGEEQVRLLLDDIWAIDHSNYCLQPIVVKRLRDGVYELIDGQQRLTTLYIIFRYMKQEGLKNPEPPFSIDYLTRPRSRKFLANIDEKRASENIDFFHMCSAYRCIREWFDSKGHRKQYAADRFYSHLFEWVKVIWYEVASDVDSTALFTRLNIGRIPLTNAELVKALLLKGAREDGASSNQSHQRRQIEIATQWDTIERELHEKGFWAFLTNRPGEDYPTRIEFLFELSAGRALSQERFHTFFHFKKQLDSGLSPDAVWEQIQDRHSLLREWYEDRNIYHKIGYLVTTGGVAGDDIAGLLRESEGITKSSFDNLLSNKITRRLNLTRDGIADLSYESAPEACSRALQLFNVETARGLNHSLERYPFHAHKTERWSLEHIHAQNAEVLHREDQWQAWLEEHLKCLRDLRLPDPALAATKQTLIEDIGASLADNRTESLGQIFGQLSVRVTSLFSEIDVLDDPHAIDNLALLSSHGNSALGNSVFEVKRQRILEMDRAGEYIPICTRRVFLKYYTLSGDQQNQFWSKQDRERYREAMFSEKDGVLSPYLKKNASEAP